MRTPWSIQTTRRPRGVAALRILCCAVALLVAGSVAVAADLTFNITKVGELDAVPGSGSQYYADVWGEGVYAYMGSDVNGGGISIYDISTPSEPQFLAMYPGDQMEDVEVYDGVGYFGSDVSVASGTGVDIVNLEDPFNPTLISRINGDDGGHNKVHTLSVSNGFLYTADNQNNQSVTDYVKVWDVSNPASPQFVTNIDLGLPSRIGTHEATAVNGRLYVASKNNGNDSGDGWTHIYDISNVGTTGPVLLKAFQTGGRTHTSTASPDGKLLVVAQERQGGEVRLYDISMIDQPNDPDTPVLLKTLTKPTTDAWSPHHPHIAGDLLFLSWYEAGLQVYNIFDPANPILVGAYDTWPGGPVPGPRYDGDWGVFHLLGYDQVLLSDRNRGLIIVDVRETVPSPDYNFNLKVDGPDFLAWQLGNGIASDATVAQGDGNRDRKVNSIDLAYWQKNFGQLTPAHAVAAPESSTISLLITGALILGVRRRKPFRRP